MFVFLHTYIKHKPVAFQNCFCKSYDQSNDGTIGSQISIHKAVKCELKPFTGTPFLLASTKTKKKEETFATSPSLLSPIEPH